jgi:hypothetical protein
VSAIRRTRSGLTWTLAQGHHQMLIDLLEQLNTAIDGPTDDPVVQRLFPRMIDDDDDADAELRMLMAGDLLLRRHQAIQRLLTIMSNGTPNRRGRVTVPLRDDEPGVMLAVLNDVRLALGARVGTTAVELRQLVDDEDHDTHMLLDTMDVLAFFQMQLLEQIDPVAAAHDGLGDLGDLGDG